MSNHITRRISLAALAATHAPGIPLTIEYAGMQDYRRAPAHLRAAIRDAGLREN